ncbi:MAG TPA: SUMF1/EgtB/PvdO family nonheme iron enzyme [Kiritimatiellia bacterium]|nr:SUMF1/EgtB/PvdO family nonheme iron enzyme [Kiritimatiellia bacterium]
MNRKATTVFAAVALGGFCASAMPTVSDVTISQPDGSRTVTVEYTLGEEAAIITLDVCTNGLANPVSIGLGNVRSLSGDVNKLVQIGDRKITWRPDKSWPDHLITDGSVVAKVTAWPQDNPPDYMAADLITGTNISYYVSAAAVDGGVTNDIYKRSKVLMRKIHAVEAGPWPMGAANVATVHNVTFTNDYYIGVYETTQEQWYHIMGAYKGYWGTAANRDTRPVEFMSYNMLRHSGNDTTDSAHIYPNPPADASFLGKIKAKTGVAFDLPSEAQWEFACRAGVYGNYWNNGSECLIITDTDASSRHIDTNLNVVARNVCNGGKMPLGAEADTLSGIFANPLCSTEWATATVGSYAPNAWGLYDMHGNVSELCLDFWPGGSSGNGAVYVGTNPSYAYRVRRGGNMCDPVNNCNSAYKRDSGSIANSFSYNGFRMAAPAVVRY